MTLEEAQERILSLEQENTELRNERDSLSQNNETLTGELGQVRALNQKYFNMLSAQYSPQDKDEPEDDPPSCEEFAKNLNI